MVTFTPCDAQMQHVLGSKTKALSSGDAQFARASAFSAFPRRLSKWHLIHFPTKDFLHINCIYTYGRKLLFRMHIDCELTLPSSKFLYSCLSEAISPCRILAPGTHRIARGKVRKLKLTDIRKLMLSELAI